MNLQVYLNSKQLGEEAERLVAAAAKVEVSSKVTIAALAETIRRIYQGFVRGEAPVGKRSYTDQQGRSHPGFLRDTIKGEVSSIPGGYMISFTSDAPYTRYVIEGTRPHVIVPRKASVLVFQAGGTTVFAKRVNHPGTRANPFNEKAWERSQPAISAALKMAGREVLLSFNP